MSSNFIEQLKRRQAGTTPPDNEATQAPPGPLPSDLQVRAEWLQDELTNTREQLEKERDARRQAERRLQAQEQPKTLADVLRRSQRHKRRPGR